MTDDAPQTHSAWPALPPPRKIALTTLPEHPCSYLPHRRSRSRGFLCNRIPGLVYHELMDAGFRRSGTFFYQMVCGGCRDCVPIRVPVATFAPSKSQRRAWRRNADLQITVGRPTATGEKFELYARYASERHGKDERFDPTSFVDFLYRSPVDTIEIEYRDAGGKLLGVGICDACPRSLSSVYFYFDPSESRRGLGTFSSLWEIEYARQHNVPHYYLGYWIRECAAMNYKAQFRPHELLCPDGVWRAAKSAGAVG